MNLVVLPHDKVGSGSNKRFWPSKSEFIIGIQAAVEPEVKNVDIHVINKMLLKIM